jgi:hypothetical protein
MTGWKSINVNDKVRFKFLNNGERIWRDYWQPHCGGRDPLDSIPADADGWREEQLWRVMTIFGPHLRNGFRNPMETEIQVQVAPNSSDSDSERSNALNAAIDYAVDQGFEGMTWLEAWREGDAKAMTDLDTWRKGQVLLSDRPLAPP